MSIHNPATQTAVRNAMMEVSIALSKIEKERDQIKAIVDRIFDEHQVEKKLFRKMAKTFHKDTYSKEMAETSEFSVVYETVAKQTTPPQKDEE